MFVEGDVKSKIDADLLSMEIKCGSGLARESCGTGNIFGD